MKAGKMLAIFVKRISIFVNESWDFGDYTKHSSYYIISMVMHNQEYNIAADIDYLKNTYLRLAIPIISFIQAQLFVMRILIDLRSMINFMRLLSTASHCNSYLLKHERRLKIRLTIG